MNNLKSSIISELSKFSDEDYYGSEEQIGNEELILLATGIEIGYKEDIVEWYKRILEQL